MVYGDVTALSSLLPVSNVTPDVLALFFLSLHSLFDQLSRFPMSIFPMSFWMARGAQWYCVSATKGFGDYVMIECCWFTALKAFRHCPQCEGVGAFDVM